MGVNERAERWSGRGRGRIKVSEGERKGLEMCVCGVDTEKKVIIGSVWFGLVQVSQSREKGEEKNGQNRKERKEKE